MSKALHFTQFAHQDHGRHRLKSLHRHERAHRRRQTPFLQQIAHSHLAPLDSFPSRPDPLEIFFQDHFHRRMRQHQFAQEIFDSLPSGVPVHSGIWQPGGIGWAYFQDTWLDGEGSFRITVLSGSQLIQSYSIYVPEPLGNGDFRIWYATIPAPVPEPATLALLPLGIAFVGFVARRARII